jgi:hypothetical protein
MQSIAFKEKFWNSRDQNDLLDEVNSAELRLKYHESLADYVVRMVRQVSYLPYKMEDGYLARRLMRKLNADCRHLLLTTVSTTDQLVDKLRTLEGEGAQILWQKPGREVNRSPEAERTANKDWRASPQVTKNANRST